MRLNAMLRFRHRGDWYNWTRLENGTDEVSYAFIKTIELSLNTDADGVRVIILSPTPMRVGSQVATVVDREGREVLPGAIFRITSVMPNVDALGNQNGYKHRAAVSNAPDFSEVNGA
jgi:hypothetical protein